MNTLLLTHPDCAGHFMPRHPERPERLTAVMNRLTESGVVADLMVREATEIARDQLARIHPQGFIDSIEQAEPVSGLVKVDPDTYMSPGSVRAARLAAGACVTATDLVLRGEARRAFCAIRPPGHHAELAEALGFCLFNNVAVGVAAALSHPGIDRVAVLDFDVHHCNGTVDIFKDDERVLVCSSFREHFYPHRYLDYSNPHIVTTPLEEGTTGDTFRRRIEADWVPAIERHKPDMIFVSAGFDAHRNDPIGGLGLVEADYAWITGLIVAQAEAFSAGRLVSTLEGGYDLAALANSALAHVEVLLQGN